MERKPWIRIPSILAATAALVLASCTSHNWPQFRGSEGNMVAAGTSYPEKWDSAVHVQWAFPVPGSGYSSPVIWGEKVFVTSAFAEKDVSGSKQQMPPPPPPPPGVNPPSPGQNPPGQPGQRPGLAPGQNPPRPAQAPDEDKSFLEDVYRWEVTCFDLQTGKELWKQVAFHGSPRIKKHRMNTYANETPVTDGKRVIAYFGMTGIFCYDMNGKPLWQKDLGAYITQMGWGTGSSPVLYNNMVYVKVDNDTTSFLVALDAATGQEKWNASRDEKTTYSTPLVWKNILRTELVTTGNTTRSYDPETGKVIWELKTGGESSIPSPVGNKEMLFLGNTGGRETPSTLYAIRAGAEGDITPAGGDSVSNGVVWSLKGAALANPSPLLYKGMLYLVSSRGGEVQCLDAALGKTVYRQKIDSVAGCWATPWAVGDRICILDEKGVTHVIKAGDKPEVIIRNKLPGKFWASVAIAGNAYIFKSTEKMFCVR